MTQIYRTVKNLLKKGKKGKRASSMSKNEAQASTQSLGQGSKTSEKILKPVGFDGNKTKTSMGKDSEGD
jgi:hypothetical protein